MREVIDPAIELVLLSTLGKSWEDVLHPFDSGYDGSSTYSDRNDFPRVYPIRLRRLVPKKYRSQYRRLPDIAAGDGEDFRIDMLNLRIAIRNWDTEAIKIALMPVDARFTRYLDNLYNKSSARLERAGQEYELEAQAWTPQDREWDDISSRMLWP